jgi:hypothetical protein
MNKSNEMQGAQSPKKQAQRMAKRSGAGSLERAGMSGGKP